MELGEKLRLARQEAGLSQRQLCGDVITRNMLSQIEHGTARPSMDTLRSLAARLGKPVSYFLEESAVISPNQELMEQARHADAARAWLLLKAFQQPDPVLEWEWKYRSFMAALAAAEQALQEKKFLYARQLLEEAAEIEHGIPGLERQLLLLQSSIPQADRAEIVRQLPSLDEELLLRAEAALLQEKPERALALLEAAEDQQQLKWNLLRGKALMMLRQYAPAADCLQAAEKTDPESCWPLLEICFRELGDFKKAYEYACKQRK